MHDSTYVEVFWGPLLSTNNPNVRWFYDKIAIMIYFSYDSLEQIEDILLLSLFGN